MASKSNLIVSLFFLFSLICVWQAARSPRSSFPSTDLIKLDDKTISSKRSLVGASVKDCILRPSSLKKWENFTEIIENCLAKHSKLTADDFIEFRVGRYNESKYFLPELREFQHDRLTACFWLTIGIGGDSEVEKQFKSAYPKCQIYGIEPSPDQHSDFSNYGTVIPLAIGLKQGMLTMRIRQGTGYNNIKVRITPLLDVLDLRIGSRLIHFATLDIEGYEYAILNALKFGKKFDKAGVSFCQIDVELHSYANQAQAMGTGFNFNEFWLDFLANSPYIPIKSDVTYFDHRKVTLINVADSVCRTLFRFDRYF